MGKANKQKSKLVKLKHSRKGNGAGQHGNQNNPFKVSSFKAMKAKNKAKAISTNLKKLKLQGKNEVTGSDEIQIQELLVQKQQQPLKKTTEERPPVDSTVDMDKAAGQFANL
ncbi:uncharacterized protein LOC100371792 [Saccoglossus kowalevskii]|uniref:Uncharacterized protein LOC100371792 n=1 Tax=Saccoglossus kowalevskii TaxID=10224 RepID=A0ABM0GXT0_SACKO|nr:PREDICTED: uncharacterized protein LOC100371792 [Saccoglossus kowalevskii]